MSSKAQTLKNWKVKGVIYDNFDELYEIYINTMNCQHCGIEFKNSRNRHLDHDHNTGLFRKIICCKCNTYDSYIKYPNGYNLKEWHKEWRKSNDEYLKQKKKDYYEKNKEQINNRKKEKIECECGCIVSRDHMWKHKKTNRHISRLSP